MIFVVDGDGVRVVGFWDFEKWEVVYVAFDMR